MAPSFPLRSILAGMVTVVIIEDDQNLREALELLLEIEGYRTMGASNGLHGVDLVRSARPEVVVTNVQMPGADGFEVLQWIRGDQNLARTRVLFLTANHHPSVRRRAVREGADAFLTKPFDMEELLSTVASLSSRVSDGQPL